jgi:hypothetical protein
MYQIALSKIEQTVYPDTTGGDQQKKESREDITFSH